MSAGGVRQALVDWLTPTAIPGLERMYRAMPTFAPGRDWRLDGVNSTSGALGYLHLANQHEHRLTMGGAHGGMKQVTYDVAVLLIYRWLIPSGWIDPVDAVPDGWVDPYDALIDAVKQRLRDDRTLGTGTGGVIWQAAEGNGEGSEDLTVNADLPVNDNGQVVAFTAVEFQVIEMTTP